MKCRELIDFMVSHGWVEERNTKGSHKMFRFPPNGRMYIIPTRFADSTRRLKNIIAAIKRIEQT